MHKRTSYIAVKRVSRCSIDRVRIISILNCQIHIKYYSSTRPHAPPLIKRQILIDETLELEPQTFKDDTVAMSI